MSRAYSQLDVHGLSFCLQLITMSIIKSGKVNFNESVAKELVMGQLLYILRTFFINTKLVWRWKYAVYLLENANFLEYTCYIQLKCTLGANRVSFRGQGAFGSTHQLYRR